MFKRLLIANRGEIACRIIRTCRRLDIETVAIYSEADRDALHVKQADAAVLIGPAPANESYLNAVRIVAAARDSHAEAVHPGYGFLSENAAFASAVCNAGLVFIGPSAQTIEAMGSKSAAKSLMEQAGVPVVPGYHGEWQDAKTLEREAARIGFPLMIKATAGGGGKGMRIVRTENQFVAALDGARREAESAFGDARVLLESYLEHPHHVEMQIFGDAHGNAVHLFERECTLQRRFQKVIEESPAPFATNELHEAMGEAAVAAARAVNYVNAGTVEFIVGADRSFYFMEMNTRLQVEHPVTEETTGIDLVEWQLRIAAGEPLPIAQADIRRCGHAIEARLYAENPAREFVPAPGRIEAVHWPAGEGVRVDTGVEAGDVIGAHYDPMVAKIIAAGANREEAIQRMRRALAATAIFGLTTNLALLRAIVHHRSFAAADFDTGFIDCELELLLAVPACRTTHVAALAARLLADLGGQNPGPWRPDAFRLTPDSGWRFTLRTADGKSRIWRLRGSSSAFVLHGDPGEYRFHAETADSADAWLISGDDAHTEAFTVRRAGMHFQVSDDDEAAVFEWIPAFAPRARHVGDEAHPQSPMPGRVVAVHVKEGAAIEAGTPLVTLEGMKMEYTVKATVAGTVSRLYCKEGDRVEAETMLVEIAPAEESDA